jgi:hypothetical protein
MVEGSRQTKHQMLLVLLTLQHLFLLDRRNTTLHCADGWTMNFHLRMLQREVLTLHQVQQCGNEVS